MKVEMGFFKCMESMARDMRHPYIPSTTVLGDSPLLTPLQLLMYIRPRAVLCIHVCMYVYTVPCTIHLAGIQFMSVHSLVIANT